MHINQIVKMHIKDHKLLQELYTLRSGTVHSVVCAKFNSDILTLLECIGIF